MTKAVAITARMLTSIIYVDLITLHELENLNFFVEPIYSQMIQIST